MIQDINRSREDLSSRNSSNSSCHRSILLVLFLGSSLTISFLTNVSNYSPFYPSLPKQRTLVASVSRLPSLFLAFIQYHWRYFSDIANVLQIWSTLCGFEELAGEFEPIRNRKIFWVKDKRVNSLASCATYSSLPVFEGTKPQVTLKLKGHSFFFLVDKEGEFLQPTLFDKTVGMKRF